MYIGYYFEHATTGTSSKRIMHIYAENQRIAMKTWSSRSWMLNYLLGDHLESTSPVVDVNCTLFYVSHYDVVTTINILAFL